MTNDVKHPQSLTQDPEQPPDKDRTPKESEQTTLGLLGLFWF